jgi:hypothetical protein
VHKAKEKTMGEPAEDWLAEVAVETERKRTSLPPSDVFALRSLVREVTVEHPVFGSLHLGWTVDRTGMRWRTWADVRIVGKKVDKPVQEVSGTSKVDHESLLALLREGRRKTAVRMLAELARAVLRDHAHHEIDEMLLAAGQRVYDPHGPNAEPVPDHNISSRAVEAALHAEDLAERLGDILWASGVGT